MYFRNLIYLFALSQLIWIDIALARRLGKLLEEHGRVTSESSNLPELVSREHQLVGYDQTAPCFSYLNLLRAFSDAECAVGSVASAGSESFVY